ncbi:hypothetical protein [Spiroplasma poulsonii]|uniref:hypothetical protein n=1 Tax=Spiroplasma poulsonii TaxID=2138 RepID=UPI001F4CCA0B|nr:hypothetical protein [Spiroplasma poulsonii]UNF62300.1 hypothetical protein MNU24_02225 [Spiroplasma poulsonii]
MLVKALIKWLFNDKTIIIDATETQSTLKRDKNNLILVKEKTHSQNTSNYRTRNQKLLQQVFAQEKTWLCFYLKNQKSQF